MYTIDANVFVAASRPSETHNAISRHFLETLNSMNQVVFCPTLVIPEAVSAVARVTDDEILRNSIVQLIKSFKNLYFVTVTNSLAQRAAATARRQRLRGADSVYVAVAEMYATTLITWDAEMVQRSPASVTASTPQMWLDQQSNNGRKNGP